MPAIFSGPAQQITLKMGHLRPTWDMESQHGAPMDGSQQDMQPALREYLNTVEKMRAVDRRPHKNMSVYEAAGSMPTVFSTVSLERKLGWRAVALRRLNPRRGGIRAQFSIMSRLPDRGHFLSQRQSVRGC